jgi:hypothetical protein
MFARTILLALCLATTAVAEERSTRFLALMGHLPEGVFAAGSAAQPEFVDLEAANAALMALRGAELGAIDANAYRVFSSFLSDIPEGTDWTKRVGFVRENIVAIAESGDFNNRGKVLMLPPAVIPGIPPALFADGYTFAPNAAKLMYWRGEVDLAVDFARQSADDPFAFPLPISSRITFEGDLLLQSGSWPVLNAMHVGAEPIPVLTAFGQVIDAPEWGERRLIGAMVFSNPMQFLPRLPKTESAQQPPVPSGGLPYWRNLMFADLSDGPNDLTLIAVLFDSLADAETAASAMQEGLPSQPLFAVQGKVLADYIGTGGKSVIVGDGPYVAVYAFETAASIESPLFVSNRGYTFLMRAAMIGDLPLLGPKMN